MTQRKLTSAEFALLRKLEAAEYLLSEINASYFDLLRSFVGYDRAIEIPLSQTKVALARVELQKWFLESEAV
jgi:CRISPR/Cas system-associated protein Cas10 (large subunit of type III CRISPR-Cas system)